MNKPTESVDTTTMPEARLERKRQINRLSAQRKRIREKHMMKVLTEKCSELVANRKILEMEREKLMSFLMIIKAKTVKEKQAVQAIDGCNANNKNGSQDKSEVIDFVAMGLLELANSGIRKGADDQPSNEIIACPPSQATVEEHDDHMSSVELTCSGDSNLKNETLQTPSDNTDQQGLGAVNDVNPAFSQLFHLIQGMKAAEDSLKKGIHSSLNQVSQADIGGGTVLPWQNKHVTLNSPTSQQVDPKSPPQMVYQSISSGSFNPPSVSSPSSSSESGSGTATISKHPPLTSEPTQCTPEQYQIVANIMNLQRNHQGSSIQESANKVPNCEISVGNVGDPMPSHSYFSTMRRASDDIRSPGLVLPPKELSMGQLALQNQAISHDSFVQSQEQMNQSQHQYSPANINLVPSLPNSGVPPNQLLWALSTLLGHLTHPQPVAPASALASSGYGVAFPNGVQHQTNQPLLNSPALPPGPLRPAPVATSQVGVPFSPYPHTSSTVQAPEATVSSWPGFISQQSASVNPTQGNNERIQIQQQVQLQLLSALIMQQAASAIASGNI